MLSLRRDTPCAFPLKKKVGQQLTRPQTTDGRPQTSKPFSPKWTEKEIPPKNPNRMEHEMLTNMDRERDACAGFQHTHVATLPCACTHLPFSSQVQRRSVCSCLRRLSVKVGLS